MILATVIDFGLYIVELIFSTLDFISLPLEQISIVFDFMCFGAWVIGADLFGFVMGNIFTWLFFKLAAGLIIFVYKLIPLT